MNHMKKITGVLIGVATFFISCTMSAKTGGEAESKMSSGDEQGKVIVVNKADFLTKIFNYEKSPNKWVYEGDKPCIIDFYADWCGPCRMMSPILEELAEEYKDEIIIYKVDIEYETELSKFFGINAIPVFLFVPKDGEPQLAKGAFPKDVFVNQINTFLLGK